MIIFYTDADQLEFETNSINITCDVDENKTKCARIMKVLQICNKTADCVKLHFQVAQKYDNRRMIYILSSSV